VNSRALADPREGTHPHRWERDPRGYPDYLSYTPSLTGGMGVRPACDNPEGMSGAAWLQVVGALFEIGGLVTVALGISRTRAQLTPENPWWPKRAWSRTTQAMARAFRRKRTHSVQVGAASLRIRGGTSRARGTVLLGSWDGVEVEKRVEQRRARVDDHQRQLSELHQRVDAEENTRREADDRAAKRVNEVDQQQRELVREVAAGSLGVEAFGVGLFIIGVVLQTCGSIVS